MIATPFRDYERQIRAQFTEIFARSGFDAGRDIAGIILNRWGHAYLSPARNSSLARTGNPRQVRYCGQRALGELLSRTRIFPE